MGGKAAFSIYLVSVSFMIILFGVALIIIVLQKYVSKAISHIQERIQLNFIPRRTMSIHSYLWEHPYFPTSRISRKPVEGLDISQGD